MSSILKKLFGKQPGGSPFGNMLRKGLSSATGGFLGTGAALNSRYAKLGSSDSSEFSPYIDEDKNDGFDGYKPKTLPNVSVFSKAKKPLNLNDYVTLPTVQTGLESGQMNFVKIAAIGIGALLLVNVLKKK